MTAKKKCRILDGDTIYKVDNCTIVSQNAMAGLVFEQSVTEFIISKATCIVKETRQDTVHVVRHSAVVRRVP
jgi:hypothetical protein